MSKHCLYCHGDGVVSILDEEENWHTIKCPECKGTGNR